jgi:hypothetical protein
LFQMRRSRNGALPSCVVAGTEGPDMEQDEDREQRIGVAILLGLAVFVLVALAGSYFQHPSNELSGIRSNIASTTR